jgi:hypothetical protein
MFFQLDAVDTLVPPNFSTTAWVNAGWDVCVFMF